MVEKCSLEFNLKRKDRLLIVFAELQNKVNLEYEDIVYLLLYQINKNWNLRIINILKSIEINPTEILDSVVAILEKKHLEVTMVLNKFMSL